MSIPVMERAAFTGLLKDEVTYELNLRGVEHERGATAEMLAALLVKAEPAAEEVEDKFIGSLNTGTELEVCARKLAELSALVPKYSTTTHLQKCWARLTHVINRLDRLAGQTRDQRRNKSSLLEELYRLRFWITNNPPRSRDPSPSKQHLHPTASGDEENHITDVRKNGVDEDVHSEGVSIPIPPPYPSHSSPIRNSPILKWGVTFDGHTCVLEFIEKIKELAASCSAQDHELLSNFSHLLAGDALIWFRGYRDNITSISQLFDYLKEEFLPVDYDRRLLLQIKGRLQEKSEDIKIYINLMLYEMSKLSKPLTETEKLEIISSNMNTFYIAKLALHEFSSIAELKSVCSSLDIARHRCENRGALNSGNTAIVPGFTVKSNLVKSVDKPFIKQKPSSGDVATVSHNANNPAMLKKDSVTCLKCSGEHHYSKCNVYNTPICFKCKKPNVLTRDCTCSKN